MGLDILEKQADQSIRQWAYAVLRSNIIKLHLKPGSVISEAEIARALKVSRTPVREAFIRLVEDGLMEIYPQKGSLVPLIDIEQAEEARFVRRVLETAIIREACEHFAEKSRFDLSANIEMQKFCQKQNNYERMFELDNEFHSIIYQGTGKFRVWLHISKMNYNFDRLRIMRLSSSPWDDILDEHSRLAQIIIDKDAASMAAAINTHLARAVVGEFAFHYPDDYFKQDIQDYAQRG